MTTWVCSWGDKREEDRGWFRSSCSSSGPHRRQGHKSRPLQLLRTIHQYTYGLVSYDELKVPAPNPFSPFSNSSRSRKFRGTLAAILYGRLENEEKRKKEQP